MARPPAYAAPATENTATSLNQILSRLDQNLLQPDATTTKQLRSSSYVRTKMSHNLEYARSLLLRLEHDSAGIKIQSRKQAMQVDLQAKRELIKDMNQRLYELNQLDDEDESEEEEDEEDDEATPPTYAPARGGASAGIDTEESDGQRAARDAADNLTSELRSRRAKGDKSGGSTDQGKTTGSSLFGHRSPFVQSADTAADADPNLSNTEQLLDHNRVEQENITASLLNMAQALKESSLQFSSSLEDEKNVLDRAVAGLDKNSMGMEAAGTRMNTLRRMTEGKGWWGRMMIYAWIAGLWVVLLVIVFVLPKLRF
ncbi:hypothetical protein K402DRAFT_398364 [Aulographum hederae CBS 113979]|uniref:Synaptobrevin n=1 Tax=Aulographum hederae CBS 113979 TaxID=1176131 RepID=A0A6G1GLB2_9PEZI|nr:hypothetical protein K402DRAFT_398364 [Aulographum hederae CBS 113979]